MRMKKQLFILLVSVMVVPVLAQDTNSVKKRQGDGRGENRKNHEQPDHSDLTKEQRKQQQKERKYKFMDKALTEIGVSDEDKIKITELQKLHRQKMKENMGSTTAAREKLSALQNAGASEAEIYAAIDEVADAQTAQLRILVRNRMEMEKILGKENYAKIMENARTQFHQRGRRGGSGLPPHPGMPPVPKTRKGFKQPPLPDTQPNQEAPQPPPPGG
jgi:hypothetical protein